MDYRLAVVLDSKGKIQQTAVLADDSPGRSEGHRILQMIEVEVTRFASKVTEIIKRDRELN